MNEKNALALPNEDNFIKEFEAINRFQTIVHQQMVEGKDYGVIPGTKNPTLLKPGAEKIAKLLGLSDQYEIVDRQEDWAKPFFRYLIKCSLVSISTGQVVSEGLGECNSMESKYRYRWVGERDLPAGAGIDKAKLVSQERRSKATGGRWTVYRMDNEEIYSQVNTILKMAKKRALVDAALSAGRLSEVFTQDIEDLPDIVEGEATVVSKSKPTAPPTTSPVKDEKPPEGENKGKATEREPASIKSLTELYRACMTDWPDEFKSSRDVVKELGYSSATDITETPEDCYRKIADTRA